jgi:hypothetical protein
LSKVCLTGLLANDLDQAIVLQKVMPETRLFLEIHHEIKMNLVQVNRVQIEKHRANRLYHRIGRKLALIALAG